MNSTPITPPAGALQAIKFGVNGFLTNWWRQPEEETDTQARITTTEQAFEEILQNYQRIRRLKLDESRECLRDVVTNLSSSPLR